MEEIEQRIIEAKEDKAEMESLLKDYLPFIKKQIIRTEHTELEYDDMLSIAMFTFVNAVKQYTQGKGRFLTFCKLCIRNRLIDEIRKQRKYTERIIPIFTEEEEQEENSYEEKEAIKTYSIEQERKNLNEEIRVFSCELKNFGISFQELSRVCPKQEKSRKQCFLLAHAVVENEELKRNFIRSQKLEQAKLAERFHISGKTIEKHRKYIVTIVLLLLGDYPAIKAFLPIYREVEK